MKNLEFPNLMAEDVELRVARSSKKGCQLLLYKNARCDMRILDSVVTPYRWQRKHEEIKGNVYCSVGIQRDDGEWVWKQDAGAESFTEAVKGEASDSFKRACFNWGIGRELYTSPFIWVGSKDLSNHESNGKRWTTYDKFYVEKLAVNKNKQIYGLAIKHAKTHKRVSEWYDKKLDDTRGVD